MHILKINPENSIDTNQEYVMMILENEKGLTGCL